MVNQKELISEIFPFSRHLVSDGYDAALERLSARFPLKVHEYKTGTPCWTWRIPPKWACEEAYIETLDGRRIADVKDNPLYVASYSMPVDAVISLDELRSRVHTHPYLDSEPPFIFYYYQDNWAFCLPKQVADNLRDEKYRVVIRSRKEEGTLKVAEYFLPGSSEQTFVISAHLDHPGQANDGLSGVITGLAIMDELSRLPERRFSYRMLIGPETIGSIAWLSHNEHLISSMFGGIFLDMTGVNIPPGLQRSYFGNTELDKLFAHIHTGEEQDAWVADYRFLVGNDERQFNAPGVRIHMLSYARAYPWGHPHRPYKEYHSTADNLELAVSAVMDKTRDTVLKMISAMEQNFYPVNRFTGEVFLSGFNIAVDRHTQLDLHRNMLKIMDMIDGTNSVADIAIKLSLDFFVVHDFLQKLHAVDLIEKRYE